MVVKILKSVGVGFLIFIPILFSVVVGYLYLQQDKLILPTLGHSYTSPPPPDFSDIRLSTPDGAELYGRVGLRSETPKYAMILFHGNGEFVSRTFQLQRFFIALGFDTYSFDYRGTGGSSGAFSEELLYSDADIISEFVQRNRSYQGLTVFGRSFGTGLASYVAAKFKARIAILVSPHLSIPDVVKDMGWFRLIAPLVKTVLPTKEYLANLHEETHIILIHGLDDQVIQPHHSEQLARTIPVDHRTLLLYETGNHNSVLNLALIDLEREIRKHIRQ